MWKLIVPVLLTYVIDLTCQTTSPPIRQPGPVRSRHRVEFGEPCNKTVRCRSEAWLACDLTEGHCQCAKPDEMVFDIGRGKCVGLIGERCMYAFTGELNDNDEPGSNKWFEIADCVDGAICSEGVCQCPSTFYEDVDANNCSPRKDFGSQCGSQVECDTNKMLVCLEGTCQCFSPSNMYFDQGERACKIKVGRKCLGLHEQYRNSTPSIPVYQGTADGESPYQGFGTETWSSITQRFASAECSNGSSCNALTGVCSCPTGLYIDFEMASCENVKEMGEPCSASEECDSTQDLTCLKGMCSCNPDTAVRNYNTFAVRDTRGYTFYTLVDTCLRKANKFCSVNSVAHDYRRAHPENKYCITDAECVSNRCTCKKHLEPTKDNMCGQVYNQPCSGTRPCSDRFICMITRPSHSPYPSTKICQCPDIKYQIYEQSVKQNGLDGSCRGLIGTPCDNEPFSCVENAECVTDVKGNNGGSICECKSGFIENEEQKCDIEYGYPCNYDTKPENCNKLAGLECRSVQNQDHQNGTKLVDLCTCPNFHDVYESNRRKCVVPVGLWCKRDDECVINAICAAESSGRPSGRCTCNDGFTVSVQKSRKFASCVKIIPVLSPATVNNPGVDMNHSSAIVPEDTTNHL